MLPAQSRKYQFVVNNSGIRIDAFLPLHISSISRVTAQRLIKTGNVLKNGGAVKASNRLVQGDTITVEIPAPEPLDLEPDWLDLEFLYEDQDIVVVNKPAGISVHPSGGNRRGTLVNGLLAQISDLSEIGGIERPGIVHRLDKDTSGIILVAKNDYAHHHLSKQFKDRKLEKIYLALVFGQPKSITGVIEGPIGRDPRNRKRMAIVSNGKYARTSYKTLQQSTKQSLLEVYLDTGRTHQIRVHMASIGHPIIGDRAYGGKSALINRQFLHAHKISFTHPRTNDTVALTADIPNDLREALDLIAQAEPDTWLNNT
ncbi:MAG: RluA family pseudouridine synthase [SAR202 cluster bacterium]|nr:RluA family pseudouridine synthase [SAR202 cluster bacterium]|tara:strand:+ start:1243 stop:2184 length:942 start_codon:yes stop_codon:yes gene_type:complete